MSLDQVPDERGKQIADLVECNAQTGDQASGPNELLLKLTDCFGLFLLHRSSDGALFFALALVLLEEVQQALQAFIQPLELMAVRLTFGESLPSEGRIGPQV